jgi:hypothetical protein
MQGYERTALIVPDVFEESISASTPRFKFVPRQNRIVDLASQPSLNFLDSVGQYLTARGTDHKHIYVAGRVLLIPGERPI